MALPEKFPGRWTSAAVAEVYDDLPRPAALSAVCDLLHLLLTHTGADPRHHLLADTAEAVVDPSQPLARRGTYTADQWEAVQRDLDVEIRAALRAEQDLQASAWSFVRDVVRVRFGLGSFAYRITERIAVTTDEVHHIVRHAEAHPFGAAFGFTTEQSHLVQVLLADGTRLSDAVHAAHLL